MAITNAQQFKQLVNPPMEGKKRPGYRGDDAYGGGDQVAGGGDQGNETKEEFGLGEASVIGRETDRRHTEK